METIRQKLIRNIKEGTFIKNVPVAIKNRFVKHLSTLNWLYFLDRRRVLTKKYEKNISAIGTNGIKFGNYYLDKRVPLNNDSIIYSFGILTDISFELSLQQKVGCAIYMYDPTPISIQFMKNYEANTLLKFFPIGVWVEDKTIRFYEPKLGGSASIFSAAENGKYFDAKCATMKTIMASNQHNHVSVFKADIEGAALPVLCQMVREGNLPDQIVAEFERPKEEEKIQEFFNQLTDLRKKLKNYGFEEYLLP